MELPLCNQFFLASLGGIIGTAAMDGIKYVGHKANLIGGVRMDMLGRWSLGMLTGKFVYDDIHHAPELPGETMAGWIFHYFTGIAVAWLFPLFVIAIGMTDNPQWIISSIIFGLSTSVLPWFVVYPAFGKGWFGSKAPKAAKPVLTSIVSHTFYGAGIGSVFALMA